MSIEEVEERGTGRVEESVPGNKLAVLQMGLGHNRDSNTKRKENRKTKNATSKRIDLR